MADDYQILLDAPVKALAQVQIAKLGDFSDDRYGDFSITADEVTAWQANLAKLPGGKAPIDFDHLADKPGAARNTEAAGWITGVALEDGVPVAEVEWTPVGESAIAEKRYQFFSPSYGPFKDETGTVTPDVLQGGALTNKPFLNMPTVNLSRTTLLATETPAENVPAADSRRHMPEITAKILEKLGLSDDTGDEIIEAKLLDAIAEPKTLEQLAKDEGKIVLDSAEHAKLKGDADKAGALEVRVNTLESERADEKFDGALAKTLGRGALDAKPETKQLWRDFYDANAESCLKAMDALPDKAAVNVTASGAGGDLPEGEAPAGIDPDAYELDRKVQAHMATEKAAGREPSYVKSLEAVRQEA